MSKRDFTLIELLVVISIIAVLLAMMLPGLSVAKEYARRSACIGNEKQQALAINCYTDDYRGWMPISNAQGSGDPTEWKIELGAYVGMNPAADNSYGDKVFKCPTWNIQGLAAKVSGGYGWSASIGAAINSGFGYQENGTKPRVMLSSVTNPSQTIVCGETTDWYSAGTWDYAYVYAPYSASAPSPTNGNRHGGGICMVWTDGHSDWKPQMTLINGVNGNKDWYFQRQK